jgi:hypothetical protein
MLRINQQESFVWKLIVGSISVVKFPTKNRRNLLRPLSASKKPNRYAEIIFLLVDGLFWPIGQNELTIAFELNAARESFLVVSICRDERKSRALSDELLRVDTGAGVTNADTPINAHRGVGRKFRSSR